MKKIITIAATLILFMSCTKELTKPDSQLQTLSVSKSTPIIFSGDDTYQIDPYTFFNECTGEEVYIAGSIQYHFQYTILRDSVHATFEAHYDNLTGIGLVSGNKYQGSGHVIQSFTGLAVTSVNDYGVTYILTPTIYNILNKATLATPGGGNNITWDLSYHLTINSSGTLIIEKIDWKFEHCQ